MKPRPSLIVACIAAISLLSSCNRPSDSEGAGVPPTQASGGPIQPTDAPKPVVGIITETECFSGPGAGYDPVGVLAPGMDYQVVAIDDDVTWIDDDVTWLQIDLAAVIDPEPPTAPVNELSPQPDPPGSVRSLRCWVPGSGVDLSGDLSGAPDVEMPIIELLGPTPCRLGEGEEQDDTERVLEAGAAFRVLGVGDGLVRIDDDVTWVQIDDDVTWTEIDDDVTWVQIDDDVTWVQIDPNALVDPEPPHQPLIESAQQPEMRTRCWVPGDSGDLSGDLSQVPVLPFPMALLIAQGYVGMPDRSPIEVEAVCGSVLEDVPAVRVSRTPPVPGDPTVTVDGEPLGLCHAPEAGVKECLPLEGAVGSVHSVRTCYPGEACQDRTVRVPACPGPGVAEVVPVCSLVFEGNAAVQVRGAPAALDGLRVTVGGRPFSICHAPDRVTTECVPLLGEAGSTATVRTCSADGTCEDWPVTVPDCAPRAEVEVTPICDLGYAALRVAYTPTSLDPPRVRVMGGTFSVCYTPVRGTLQCLALPGAVGSIAMGSVCFAGEPCSTWTVPVPDCSSEAGERTVEAVPICSMGFPAVQVRRTPISLEAPRVTVVGGRFSVCHAPERGVVACLPLPGDAGSIASGTACYPAEPCDEWSVAVLDCAEELVSEGKMSLAGTGCHDEKRIFFILDTRLPWLVPGAAFDYTATDGPTGYSCSVHPTIAGRLYCSGIRPGEPGGLEVCIQQGGTSSPICHTFADWPEQENAIQSCVPAEAPPGLAACSSFGFNNCPLDRCKWDRYVGTNGACVPK